MAEKVKENSRFKKIVQPEEKIDIHGLPQIIEWSNGSKPESKIHDVIQLSRNRNQPDWNDDRFANVCYEDLITEDDEPVDNIPSEKQQRLLAQSLYDAGYLPEPFLVTANVGLFDEPAAPPIVPDVMISLGVKTGDDPLKKENRSYFVWKEKKPPEVVVEIVSNKEGNETGSKFERYATIGVKYYVIIDEGHHAQEETLVVHELGTNGYIARDDYHLPDLNLALTFWDGIYEQSASSWVRWCTLEGDLLLTGKEEARQEKQRAEEAEDRVEKAKDRAEEAESRVKQAKLRAEQAVDRAEQAESRVKQEKLRAEQAVDQAKEVAEKLAEQAQLAAFYMAKLREAGVEIDELG